MTLRIEEERTRTLSQLEEDDIKNVVIEEPECPAVHHFEFSHHQQAVVSETHVDASGIKLD